MSFITAAAPPTPATSPWRDVRLAAAAKGLSTGGEFLIATTLVLAFQSSGAGGLPVAALLLAKALPLVVLAPITGRLADRVESRRLLALTGLGQAVIAVVLTLTGHPVAVVALAAALAAGLAVVQPTISALIPSLVARADLPRAGAVSQTAGTIGMMVGPAAAGLLVGRFGTDTALLLGAASYLGMTGAALALPTRRGSRTGDGPAAAQRPAPTTGPPADPTAPAAPTAPPAPDWSLWRDPLLRAMVASIAAVVGAVGAINVVAVFFVRETLGASETVYGLVEAIEMGGVLAGAWLFARIAGRMRDDAALVRGVLLLLAGMCATLPVASVVGTAGWLVPLWLITGLLNGGMNVFTGVVMASRVPAAIRGRAFATLGAAVQAAALAGYFAGGVLVELLPIRPTVAGLGAAGLAVVAALLPPVLRATHRERRQPPGAALTTPSPASARGPGSGDTVGA